MGYGYRVVTVKELINQLLDCDMNTPIKIKTYGNLDDPREIEYDEENNQYIMDLD